MANYLTFKAKKVPLKFEKLKPEFGGKYPKQFETGQYLFKNPIFENYVTQYMESTQKDTNEHINMDQFKSIVWQNGMPALIIEIMCYLTGEREETTAFYESVHS